VVGDELLQTVAQRLSAHVRGADTAARLGGDEFAVLLHEVPDTAAVEAVVGRLQDDLARPCDIDSHHVAVTASVGVWTSASSYEPPEDILRDADRAMYTAKAAGRAGPGPGVRACQQAPATEKT
jgi:diguanylate cyclase (GGDEF)-like protein